MTAERTGASSGTAVGSTVVRNVTGWAAGAVLGPALWVGFPVVLLTSSVVHEKVRGKLAALHAGDWLAKLLIIAVIVIVSVSA